MANDIQRLIDKYVQWLKDKSVLRQVDDQWAEITTPYLDRHNDYLQIYVAKTEHGYRITDDGYIISDLRLSGCELDTEKRSSLLQETINGFGVSLEGEELTINAGDSNFPLRKHNLLQAMLAVNDLFYLAQPTIRSLFLEDVTRWFDANQIRYVEKVKFTGKSGYDHQFDFAIPASNGHAERLVRTINRPTRNSAEALAFAWVDTREVRKPNTEAYAFLNDEDGSVPDTAISALTNYEVKPIMWTKREQYINAFVG